MLADGTRFKFIRNSVRLYYLFMLWHHRIRCSDTRISFHQFDLHRRTHFFGLLSSRVHSELLWPLLPPPPPLSNVSVWLCRCAIRYMFANLSNCLSMQWSMLHRFLFSCWWWCPVWNWTAVAQHDLCSSCNFVCLSTSMRSRSRFFVISLCSHSSADIVDHHHRLPEHNSNTITRTHKKIREDIKTTTKPNWITLQWWCLRATLVFVNLNTIIIVRSSRHWLAHSALNSDFGVSITCSNDEHEHEHVCVPNVSALYSTDSRGADVFERRSSAHSLYLPRGSRFTRPQNPANALFTQSREFNLAKWHFGSQPNFCSPTWLVTF